MKPFLLAFCIALVALSTGRGQSLTAEDLARATEHLKKTSGALLAATEGLSDAQLAFKPGPTRWSVAEVAEHIAATEDLIMTTIKEQVMKGPARTEKVDLRELDDFVLTAIADRSNKAQAPDPLVPTNRFGSAAAALKHFRESRAATVAFLTGTKDLREHAIDSPLGRKLDAYQWLLFISAHCERHTKQILEVKADASFPKK